MGPADIEKAATDAGIRIVPMHPHGNGYAAWTVDGTGWFAALLSWTSDGGLVYRARVGRRWKTWKRGKRLSTVLDVVAEDVRTNRRHARK